MTRRKAPPLVTVHRTHPDPCGLYEHPMRCEQCGCAADHLGTRHVDRHHLCWPCLGYTGGVAERLAGLNEARKALRRGVGAR